VLFLVAVGRPRYDAHTRKWVDGKLGVWPFVEMVESKRSSTSRPAGTPELKCLSIAKTTYKAFLIEKIITAIKAK
ncbi:hypothetical protein L917_16960, partial [Phytophthora nicotianae]